MRQVAYQQVVDAVAQLAGKANFCLGPDVLASLQQAKELEESPQGQEVLNLLLENAEIAAQEQVPICQDTGMAVVFLEVGQDVRITGGCLEDAINEGIRNGYTQHYLRKSMVADPLQRRNTGDNTPAIIHTKIVSGDRLVIVLAPKGGGSENMSAIKMLTPADGVEGVKQFVVETVSLAGSNPCPPVVVGVGLGGNFEKAALLSKQALLRPLGQPHADQFTADLEKELLMMINNLGIGPQGFGGRITALAVHIENYPCHIACLPVAVNLNCHAARHSSVIL